MRLGESRVDLPDPVLVLDGNDRAGGFAYDALGDAAQNGALQAGETVGGHHDQVAFLLFRPVQDLLDRVALEDGRFCSFPSVSDLDVTGGRSGAHEQI